MDDLKFFDYVGLFAAACCIGAVYALYKWRDKMPDQIAWAVEWLAIIACLPMGIWGVIIFLKFHGNSAFYTWLGLLLFFAAVFCPCNILLDAKKQIGRASPKPDEDTITRH